MSLEGESDVNQDQDGRLRLDVNAEIAKAIGIERLDADLKKNLGEAFRERIGFLNVRDVTDLIGEERLREISSEKNKANAFQMIIAAVPNIKSLAESNIDIVARELRERWPQWENLALCTAAPLQDNTSRK